MFHASGVDVLMGGGAAHFPPKSSPGSHRKDEINYVAKFRAAGYAVATTEREMKSATADPATRKLLGRFHPDTMDGVLDRKFLKQGTVTSFPEQPDLGDMVRTALTVLARHDDGVLLMVTRTRPGEDVVLTAMGPGAERARGFLDNTEIFRIIVDALGLAATAAQ